MVKNDTQTRLLQAAILIFGQWGYEAATTRLISRTARTNQQAILYHFNGKRGLYLASIEHIITLIWNDLSPTVSSIEHAFQLHDQGEKSLSAQDARQFLTSLTLRIIHITTQPESTYWANFLNHEQIRSTDGFPLIHNRLVNPLIHIFGRLIQAIKQLPQNEGLSLEIKIQGLLLIKGLLVACNMRASLLTELQSTSFSSQQIEIIERAVLSLLAEL